MNNASHPLTAKVPAGIGLLLITLLIVGAITLTKHDTATKVASSQPASNNAVSSSQAYKDGTYTETGHYSSPAGTEALYVTLTVANGAVSSSMVTSRANDPTASSYQSLFISGYKGMVEGKKLGDIHLKNVSGSSLTPKGFMDALNKIADDAKA